MHTKDIRGFSYSYYNTVEFRKLFDEIFKEHIYYVEFEKLDPYIIDVGAHIGLTSLYYKQLYINAKILAFEPVAENYQLFLKNIEDNRLTDITVINKAIWSTEGRLTMFVDADPESHWNSTSSIIEGAWNQSQQTKAIEVDAVRLSPYLDRPIDVLKIDVEGAETEIFKEIRPKLHFVKHLFIEFHATRTHRPEELVTMLLNGGFEVTVYQDHKTISTNQMTRRKPTLYLIEAFPKNL